MDAVVSLRPGDWQLPGLPIGPQAYCKRGGAFARLGETASAREWSETLIKVFPESDTNLAQTAARKLNRQAVT